MSIEQVLTHGAPLTVSFEFFPPKTEAAEDKLWQAIRRLEPLRPRFVSVTYGAGGSTRERTHNTVRRIVEETTLTPAAHLTCVAAPRADIDEVAHDYWNAGVRHIVALRGDMAEPGAAYAAHADGYESTPALIEGIRRIAPFEISVSAYPERHPDSASIDHDVALLKRKVDAGASRAIAQFCFDIDAITRLRDHAAEAGVDVPIVPGLMPTTNFSGIRRMAALCGATTPDWLIQLHEGLDDDPDSRKVIAAAVMAEQVQALHARGFEQFHFYTLNQADLTYAACRILGIFPSRGTSKETS